MAQILKLMDGSPLKIKGKDVYEMTYPGVIKQVDVEGRRMTMIGTDETKDRDGDIIELNGWRLEDYRKNPVFLWAHNYGSVPLARAEKLIKRREPRGMEFHLTFPTKGLHPFADMILDLYGEKIINASSVGFIPWEWDDIVENEDEKGVSINAQMIPPSVQKGRRRPCGRKYKDQELLELSGCAVPSNPNALQNAIKGKSFIDMPFDEVQKWLQGQAIPPRPKQEDDVLEELCFKEVKVEDETKPKQVQVPLSFCEIVDETKEKEEEKETPECPNWDGKLEELEVPPYDEKDGISIDEVGLKPYPNEHACRIEDPGKFERFARKNCFRKHDGKCVDFIFGYPKEGGGRVQALRYPKDTWTASAARSHCSSHDGSFEAAGSASVDSTEDKQSMEAMMKEMLSMMKKMMTMMESIVEDEREDDSVSEAVEPLKPVEVVLDDKSKEPNPNDGKKETKSASEAILDEAYSSKEKKSTPSSPVPVQYDLSGVMNALEELKTQFKRIGGN